MDALCLGICLLLFGLTWLLAVLCDRIQTRKDTSENTP
jgi:hypothetical protein